MEEDQTLEHDLMGGEENHNTFEMTETEPSIENYKNEIEGNQSLNGRFTGGRRIIFHTGSGGDRSLL